MVNFNSNVLGQGIARNINQQSDNLSRVFEQLSTGNRITSFGVDASGGAIATQLETAFRGLGRQIAQDQTQINRLQTEEAGLSAITDELQQIRELQVQAGNGTLAEDEIEALQAEVNQRLGNIQGLVNDTQFAGTGLIEAGPELEALLEEGVEVTADTTSVDAALDEVTAERSEIGAEINGLTSRINEREISQENIISSFSRISDTDIALGVSEQVNSQILQLVSIGSLNNLFAFNRQNAMTLLNNF